MPLPSALRVVTWEEHDSRKYEVHQVRCLVCGASDLIKRDFNRRHEKTEPIAGQASPHDGRMFVAQPLIEED